MTRLSNLRLTSTLVLSVLSVFHWGACDGTTSPPVSDACEGMPEAPEENGVPIGTCPFWVAPTQASGACAAQLTGFDDAPLAGPDADSAVLCRYTWSDPSTSPSAADIASLPEGAESDCTFTTPQANADALTFWARDELRASVGARLPSSKSGTSVRVTFLDTVGEKSPNVLPAGAQHGRTLAAMATDLACEDRSNCPIQVRSVLALPRQLDTMGRPVVNVTGGSFGLLSDVTEALWNEVRARRSELSAVAQNPDLAKTTPLRWVLVSAFGFDNNDVDSPCSDDPSTSSLAVQALADAYHAAGCLGGVHISAAGNSPGGPQQGQGLLCPARWDHAVVPSEVTCAALWGNAEWNLIKQDFLAFSNMKHPGAALFTPESAEQPPDHLLSVAGVDFHGAPLALSRPSACAEAVAIGFGGIGWVDDKDVPPFLNGTSVSAALVGARLAVRWHASGNQVATDLVQDLLAESNTVPFSRAAQCDGAEAYTCPQNIPWLWQPSTSIAGQNPAPSNAVRELRSARQDNVAANPPGETVCTSEIPHCVVESRAASNGVWPQPIDPLCVKCGVFVDPTPGVRDPELWLDGNPSINVNDISGAAFVLEDENGQVVVTKPLPPTAFASATTVTLTLVDPNLVLRSRAWLSAYMRDGSTISQPIFVIE
ncbi:MAG: hypothetical protein IPK82_21965 [Polyangiaceae bacterium]|nr:hypothetical protein [Polyangiaceae bacterium]